MITLEQYKEDMDDLLNIISVLVGRIEHPQQREILQAAGEKLDIRISEYGIIFPQKDENI